MCLWLVPKALVCCEVEFLDFGWLEGLCGCLCILAFVFVYLFPEGCNGAKFLLVVLGETPDPRHAVVPSAEDWRKCNW